MCWALDKIDPLQQLEAHFAAAEINVGALRLATSAIAANAISLVSQAAVATANVFNRDTQPVTSIAAVAFLFGRRRQLRKQVSIQRSAIWA